LRAAAACNRGVAVKQHIPIYETATYRFNKNTCLPFCVVATEEKIVILRDAAMRRNCIYFY
jgi:hypothetical protein